MSGLPRTPEGYATEFVHLMWQSLGFAYHDTLIEPLAAAFENAMKHSHRAGMEAAAKVCDDRARSGHMTFKENWAFGMARNTIVAVMEERSDPPDLLQGGP